MDEGSVGYELAVDVKYHLQAVTLAGVLGVEQFHQLKTESLVDVLLGGLGIDLRANNETDEKFVHHLEVRPRRYENWLVLLGIEVIGGRGECMKDIRRDHCH